MAAKPAENATAETAAINFLDAFIGLMDLLLLDVPTRENQARLGATHRITRFFPTRKALG
ncbi:MAG: hypothetical protein WAT70_13360 [Rhizobiaceae bacterium]